MAVAAVANKLARTIWAVLAKGKPYDPAAFSAVAQEHQIIHIDNKFWI